MPEFFLRPICRVEADTEAEATEKILEALFPRVCEIRGWA